MYNCYPLTIINPHIPADFSAQITLHIWAQADKLWPVSRK